MHIVLTFHSTAVSLLLYSKWCGKYQPFIHGFLPESHKCPPDLTGTLHLCFRWLSYTVHARYSLAAVTSRALFGVTFCSADEITDDRSEQRPTAHSIIHLLLTICHLRFLTMTEIIHFHRMCRELHALHSSYFTLHRCFTTL